MAVSGVFKITINGETFSYDFSKKPMSECLALERGLGMPYDQYEEGFQTGNLRAICGFVWTVWHRGGRAITLGEVLEQIESGTLDFDLFELADSLTAIAAEAKKAAEAEEAENPTVPAGTPGASPSTWEPS